MSIYSVKIFDMANRTWPKRGIRVEAESPKEARVKIMNLKGITGSCLTVSKWIKDV